MFKRNAALLTRRSLALLPVVAIAGASLLTGCGVGTVAAPSDIQTVALHGMAHGGQQPVTGGHIALFATTSAGYGGTLTPLATTTTQPDGTFNITGAYTCPSTQQAYLVATGGNPGATAGTDNSAIFLVAALGSCSSLSRSTFVQINEVTTVAAAYALSGFLPAGGVGLTEAAVVADTAMPGVTTSATNTQGLADAFGNANNIVDFEIGGPYATTPGGNGTVPVATINTLADILQTCVNTTGPGATGCTSLFGDATPPTGSGIAAPVNVFQAAIDIAQYPGNNVANLLNNDVSPSPAFEPALSTAPSDWTIGVVYTSSLLVSGTGLGIDNTDDVYVSGAGYLIDFSAQGAPLSTTNLLASDANITATDTLREIAFDLSGNLFVTDGALTGVYEYTPSSQTITELNFNVAPASDPDPDPNTYTVAVDGLGDVWVPSYSKAKCTTAASECLLVEFPANATTGTTPEPTYTPYASFNGFLETQPTNGLGGARGIAFDVKTGNIWTTDIDDNLAQLFKVTPSSTGPATATAGPTTLTGFGTEVSVPASNNGYGTISVAVDKSSNAWFIVAGGAAVTTGSNPTSAVPAAIYPVTSAGVVGTGITGGGLDVPFTVAIDGNNNLFVASTGTGASSSSVVEYSPGFNSSAGAFLSPNNGFNPGATFAAGKFSGGSLYEPSFLAIDRSGAVWTLNSGNGTSHATGLVQILGVAAPTDPVLAAGKYGAKP